MTDRAIMQQALEALELLSKAQNETALDYADNAIDALRTRLAQPEQEPVAWRDHVEQRLLTWRQSFVNRSGDQLALDDFMDKQSLDDLVDFVCDEYTTPPQRTWVGLTDEEIDKIYETKVWDARRSFARAIEAKLKERNT